MQSRWFDFGGDTIVRTDKYIRLASDKPSRSGWIFSRVPLTATNWEVCTKLIHVALVVLSNVRNLYSHDYRSLWNSRSTGKETSMATAWQCGSPNSGRNRDQSLDLQTTLRA